MKEQDFRGPGDGRVPIVFEFDEDTLAHYEARARASGRTLEAQLGYELRVNHGKCPPDPGDLEATQRGQVFRRIFAKTPLNG